MMVDELTIKYRDPRLGQRLRQFAHDHRSAKWRHFARFNLDTIVVSAVSKGN